MRSTMCLRTRAVLSITAVITAFSTVSSAQVALPPGCTVTPSTIGTGRDICQKAAELFAFVVPQVGVALAGGNAMPGEGGTLGGWGKRAVSLRLVAVDGRLPRNSVPLSITAPNSVTSDFGAVRTFIPTPAVDLGVGFIKGLPVGVTNVGGVDLLLGVTVIPKVSQRAMHISQRERDVAFSYGVRVGALQESAFIPGLSATFVRRRLPALDFDYTPNDDTLQLRGTVVTSNSLRVMASKRIVLFGLAVGVGRDEIEATTGLGATVNDATAPVGQKRAVIALPNLTEKVRRSTAFVNASLGLIVARIVGEFGWSSAGTVRETVNTFGGRRANEGYRYGSIGITTRF